MDGCLGIVPRGLVQILARYYGPSQKIGNVGQVANLPKTRQIGNLPHVGMLHIYSTTRQTIKVIGGPENGEH